MKYLINAISAMLLLAVAACTSAPQPVRISRLDKAMQVYADAPDSSRMVIADTLAAEIDAFFTVLGHPNPGEAELDWWSHGDEVAVFQPDVDKVYPSLTSLEATLGHVYRNAAKEKFTLDTLRFASIVYGQPRPIVRVDSVMLIALNHYLGADYPGYSHWDAYRRAEKTPSHLPYDLVAALVSTSHPAQFGAEASPLIANMLYEGALVEARMRLLPNADLATALGVTPEELQFMQGHISEMWREMAEKKMIYDTNPLISDRLLSGAPSSPLLGGVAPGRAGRYVGYRIVEDYLKSHRGATLSDLFSPEFYANPASTLSQAKLSF